MAKFYLSVDTISAACLSLCARSSHSTSVRNTSERSYTHGGVGQETGSRLELETLRMGLARRLSARSKQLPATDGATPRFALRRWSDTAPFPSPPLFWRASLFPLPPLTLNQKPPNRVFTLDFLDKRELPCR